MQGWIPAHLDIAPLLIPVPGFDGHVVAACKDDRCGRVDSKASDVVRVSLESDDFFMGVVVEDA